jgi:adenosine deaminase
LAQTPSGHKSVATPRPPAANPQEQRVIRVFNTAKQSPLELTALLERMPKGADLHMHLSGAIYAETFIKDAAADGLCVNLATLSFFKPAATTRSIPPQPACGEGNARADSVFKDQHLYDSLVDSFSMRSFVPSTGFSGHDQFFATFARFSGIDKSHTGEWLDEVATRAAAQNEQYLEIMQTATFSGAAKLGYSLGWPATASANRTNPSREDLAHLR